jgi:predicted Zn-dependent protease
VKSYLQTLATRIFSDLAQTEELSMSLHSEESDFIRFNSSKVRQNTSVYQHELTLKFQFSNRCYKSSVSLNLDLESDSEKIRNVISNLRLQLPLIDENPKYENLINHGVSEVYKKCERPSTETLIEKISSEFSDSDLAGFLTCGPIRQASVNSKGQFHYFENDQFFFDYSIYDGPRAAKGYYSSSKWSDDEFTKQANQIKNTLSMLKRPHVKLKPGAYRTYLAPMALAEIAGVFNWRAVSRGEYEKGFAPLKKLYTNELLFSDKFSLIENNELGLNSHFNSLGEISPKYLPIIEAGTMKNFLINSETAKEYGLISNNADAGMWSAETMRSMEIRAGTLAEIDILQSLDTGLYLTNLHYINWSDPVSARITGMTRFACFWVEKGEIVGPIQDMRFDDSLYNIFGSELIDLTSDRNTFVNTSTYTRRDLGGMIVPGVLLNKMNFTL